MTQYKRLAEYVYEIFEKQYREEPSRYGDEPSILFYFLMSAINRKKVKVNKILELGAGEGRDTIPLAFFGQVVAVEITKSGCEKIEERAVRNGIAEGKLKIFNLDMDKLIYNSFSFDLVYANASIHFLGRTGGRRMLENIMNWTSVGGVNALSVFTKNEMGRWRDTGVGYFSEKELLNIYMINEWEILSHGTVNVYQGRIGEHTHLSHSFIITQKIK